MLQQSPQRSDLRDFGDQALMFVSIMPQYGQRRGLSMHYYAGLGISAYHSYAALVSDPRFTQLAGWFYYLQRFLNSALRSQEGLELLDLD
jgi:hypothetical protein